MMKRIFFCIALLFVFSISYSQKGSKPFVLGVTEEIASKQLGENRTLNIYLPDGCTEDDTTKYAVIYLLDGSADEDFIHVAGLVQFNTFPWIARMPKSIVVGIANTDRKRDMTFASSQASDQKLLPTSGGSAKFMAFIEKELQPYIEHKYRVSKEKMLIGESLGGLLATEILLTKPGMFDKYVIVSPSLWWDGGSMLKREMNAAQLSRKTSVYIAVGKEGLTPSEPARVMEVDANLLADKLNAMKNKKLKVYFDYLPEETHATIGHQAVFNGFRKLYPTPSP